MVRAAAAPMGIEHLRAVPALAGLGDDELRRLLPLGRQRWLASGEYLFRQGEAARVFHVVLEGRLETIREVAGEQGLVMAHEPGGHLGAMGLLTDPPYRASTYAVGETVLFELDGEELRRVAFAHPPVLRAFLPVFESVSGMVKGLERDREKLFA